MAAAVSVSTCSGICRISRSLRAAVTLTSAGQAAQLELHGQIDGLVRALDDDRPRRFGEAARA